MARSVYRYYKPGQSERAANQPLPIEGVMVVFVPDEPVDTPLFIVGHLEVEDGKLESEKDEWALQKGFFEWSDKHTLDEVIRPSPPPPDDQRIKSMKLIAVPLYQITNISEVQAMMTRLRQAP